MAIDDRHAASYVSVSWGWDDSSIYSSWHSLMLWRTRIQNAKWRTIYWRCLHGIFM